MDRLINFLVLSGLIVPPAVVPTIWVMQELGIFKTLPGLVLIEVAFGLSFCVLLFRAFVSTIPRELDEAALIDGAGPSGCSSGCLPAAAQVIITVIVVQAVFVFNDFTNPLYFLPGRRERHGAVDPVQLPGPVQTSWNLLFMDILLITIPPLVMYIFFNRQIVAGLTSGAVKG